MDDQLLIKGSIRLFFETSLFLRHGISEERSAGVWVGRSVSFDCKHYKSLSFEIPNLHKVNSFGYLGRYSRMSVQASMLACVILLFDCL